MDALTSTLPPLGPKHFRTLRVIWRNRRHGTTTEGTAVELDLHRHGYIELKTGHSGNCYNVTEAGIAALAVQTDLRRERQAPHRELANRVAQWLHTKGRITWEGVEFIVKEHDVYARAAHFAIDVSRQVGVLYATPRPDVYSVVPTFNETRLCPWAFEVKVSRADFLSDLANPLKRLAYGCIAEHVYYVLPVGMADPTEIPQSCGLVEEVAPGEFKVTKRAKKYPTPLKPAHYMKMVLKTPQGLQDF